jgi:SAM-dependent methyltransferase
MIAAATLHEVLADNQTARALADDIWSVLPPEAPSQPYDGRAKLYDRLIGSNVYNRLAWGTSPADYAAFASTAAGSGQGSLLDAGCGTLVSTVQVHVRSGRTAVLVDLSVDMLRAARGRLVAIAGRVPENIVLLQADLRVLPFRDRSFGAVLCPGMLHLFDDLEVVTRELARVTMTEARIFASSLVTERWIGRQYLGLLHRAGEAAKPRAAAELLARLNSAASGLASPVEANVIGSMAFVSARAA